jgi:taurine dioxygenase
MNRSIDARGVMPVEFRPLQGSFGAEVVGVPPTLEMDENTFRQVETAWYRHSILLFRGLTMTPLQHIAFTRRLGPLHIMEPPNITLPDHPEVFVVSNATKDGKPVGLKRAGEGFHSDGEDKAIPNAGSFLYAITVPPERGDTLFVDMYSAYDALPDDIKCKLAGKHARFSRIDMHHIHYPLMAPYTEEQKRKRPDVFHPIFRKHPKSGRTALYLGRWACDIEGMPPEEGRALIKHLQEFAQQPRFIFRQRWRVGDAVLWDNRCTQHCATGFDDEKYIRTMYRTTLEGEAPVMADTGHQNAA